ncbi:MAG TPA: zf-HC2 domain-containing protein [Pyrinomonadaceae bacterium]
MPHLTQKQLEDYASQQLQASELLAVSDHLDQCELCRRQIEAAMNGDRAFFAMCSDVFTDVQVVPAHLTPAQISDYVDDALAGEAKDLVTDHLSSCEHCAVAVADVRRFRNELSLDHEHRPASKTASGSSWVRRTYGSLSTLFRVHPLPAFGSAALAVLLFAAIAWLILRKQSEQAPNQQIAVAPTPASQTTPVPSVMPSPNQPAIVAQLNDGNGALTLDEKGELAGANELPPEYQKRLKTALADQRIPNSSQLTGLTRAGSSLMSGNNEKGSFRVIAPVGTVVLTNSPTFRWSVTEGASHYVVEIYDDKFNLVVLSPQLQTNSWTISQPLPRGKIYTWQVKADKDGEEVTSPRPPAPQARFRIVNQSKAHELDQARRMYPSSHLMLALLYADAGLLAESEEQLRLLVKANPNSEIARKLLRQIQAQRR